MKGKTQDISKKLEEVKQSVDDPKLKKAIEKKQEYVNKPFQK